MRILVVAAATIALAFGASVPASATAGDPLGCADQVFDPTSVASTALADTVDVVARDLDADVHVRIEGSLDGDIDGREFALEHGCAGWLGVDGQRAHDLLVVMVSPAERQTSIYYGGDFDDTLAGADPQIQQYVMNPRFQAGDIEQGLIDGLHSIAVAVHGGGVPAANAAGASAFSIPDSVGVDDSSSSSGGGIPGLAIFAFVVLAAIAIGASWWAKQNGWSSGSTSSGWSSGSSRVRGFSGRSSHHSSSSHSSSSHSSSHHSGGGGSSSSW
ncbi:MAG: hypothetical protein JWL72_4754 [Ilumatobacteraceae bacterium]|nr:hypothetical protein [Ilumatobacteraceae bacterium]